MKPAQQEQVAEVGLATKRPVLVVMGFGSVSRHAAAREAAEAISNVERQTQPVRHHALLATDVDRQAIPFDHADHLGIAANPLRHRCRKR